MIFINKLVKYEIGVDFYLNIFCVQYFRKFSMDNFKLTKIAIND